MEIFAKHEDQLGIGLSYPLWKNFPMLESLIFRDHNVGYGIYPNLASFDSAVDAGAATVRYGSDGARIYVDAGCAVHQLPGANGGIGGGIRMSTTAVDNVEAWIQWCGANGSPFIISDTAAEMRDLVFEACFRIDTVADAKCGFFIGLMESGCAAADTITDAGAMADKDFIGFWRREGDGDKLDIVYQKSGQTMVTHKADWKTIAADTWYHVGLRWDAGAKTITPWFGTGDRSTTKMAADTTNKILASDISSTTDYFPDSEALAPIVGLKNATNVQYNLDLRLLACAQASPAAA